MVDLNTCPPTPPAGESSNKIKNLMGRTPGIGILKSKFLTVLGNSNELLNGISNKLTLSISSSESEYCDDDEEVPDFDESIDYTKIDFESRRLKARRAHEEIISGRYRHPNLAPKPRLLKTRSENTAKRSSSAGGGSSSSSPTSSSTSCSRSLAANAVERSRTTRSNSIESRHSGGYGRPGRAVAGARRSDLDLQRDVRRVKEVLDGGGGAPQIDVQPPSDKDQQQTGNSNVPCRQAILETAAVGVPVNSIRVPARSKVSNSSTLTSLRDDEAQISPSVESATDWRNFIRSESQNSVPSWASSISLDCRTGEEPVKEFMKHFTDVLFNNASVIGLDLKAEFGTMSRLETGRQWFTRFLLEQNARSKRVDELTFYSLVQFLAIILFECGECEDFIPAATITNLCFAFYREIDVPGCDPYREYLFIVMRQQPIWNNLRFWNAAFFEVVQSEQQRRLALKLRSLEKQRQKKQLKEGNPTLPVCKASSEAPANADEVESSSSSSHHSNAIVMSTDCRPKDPSNPGEEVEKVTMKETKMQETITFQQLGTFTCNMHALGVPRELCMEFLKKQSLVSILPKDKLKLIKDNVQRMYHETDKWGAKMT